MQVHNSFASDFPMVWTAGASAASSKPSQFLEALGFYLTEVLNYSCYSGHIHICSADNIQIIIYKPNVKCIISVFS